MARIFITLVLFISSTAMAQQVRVQKVKGDKAIVQFYGTAPEVGRNYNLTTTSGNNSGAGKRDSLIDLGFTFLSTTREPGSSKVDVLNVSLKYGWNNQTYEIGPLLSYASTGTNGITKSTLSGGMFFDFNLVPNLPGTEFVYGIGAEASFGSSSTGGGSSTTVYGVTPVGFLKWFAFGNSVAIRTDLGYSYVKYSGSGADYTEQGFGVISGISAYF